MNCLRDCQHPWFGGNGECIVGADGASACVCDSGFSALDVLGQPACESKAARTSCHAAGCVLSVACFVFAAKKLSATLRASFEGGQSTGGAVQMSTMGLYTRPRIVFMLLISSILWSVSVLIFHVTAWRTRLTLQTLFPLMTFSVAWGAVGGLLSLRLWLFILPSRLMGKTSIPTVIKVWSDDRHGLAIATSCYWVWIICCGIVGRSNTLRARVMMLGSTGPMVGFYALVVLSVSLTLSKAIRDAEGSRPLQRSGISSSKGLATVVGASTSSHDVKRWGMPWVRRDFGSSRDIDSVSADAGGGGHVGAASNRTRHQPKANGGGGYSKTKSMLKKLTRASVAVMAAVLVVILSGLRHGTIAHDTPVIFFMALFTTMPSIWLIITMRFLTRESSSRSSPAAAASPPVRSNSPTNAYSAGASDVGGSKTNSQGYSSVWRLLHTAGVFVQKKKVSQRVNENHRRVRDAAVVPVLHQ